MDRSAVSCQRLLTAVFAVVFVLLIALVVPSIAIDEGIRSYGRPLLQASCSKQIGCIHILSVAMTLLIETVTITPRLTSDPVTLQEFSPFAIIWSNSVGSRAPPAFTFSS